MRAVLVRQFGDPRLLRVEEVATPEPGDGEALVKVTAAGVNPSDVKNVQGVMHGTTLPRVPGRDFAGVVPLQPQARRMIWSPMARDDFICGRMTDRDASGKSQLAKLPPILHSSQTMEREINVSRDMDDLLFQAAERITAAAEKAIGEKGDFSIALSGGHTPEGLYKLLTREPYRSTIDWSKVSIYFGDERCVPPDSDQSNYRMANESLLSKAPIRPERIYRMRGEIDPQQAAKEYGELLKAQFGDEGLDMILLGMGDDGHTASLFPGTEALHERKHRCVAHHVEKLNAWRITMTAPFINRAEAVMILVAGRDKAARVKEVLEGPSDPERLPIQMIQPESGKLTWLLDAGAAGMFEEE